MAFCVKNYRFIINIRHFFRFFIQITDIQFIRSIHSILFDFIKKFGNTLEKNNFFELNKVK